MSVAVGARTGATGAQTAASAAIGSATFTLGVLYIAHVVEFRAAGSPAVPTSVRIPAGLQFTRKTSHDQTGIAGTYNIRESIWYVVGDGSTGAVTVTAAQTDDVLFFSVSPVTGFDTGNGGADALPSTNVGVGNGSGSSPTINLPNALQDANSVCVAEFAFQDNGLGAGIGPSFTSISGFGTSTPPVYKEVGEWRANVTAATIISSAGGWVGVAYEIKAPSTVKAVVPTIAATSSMTASVRRQVAPITVASVAATSSASASIARYRAIKEQNAILAISGVSASVARLRLTLPASIAATSSVSALIGRIKPFAATVVATSVLALAVARFHFKAIGDTITASSPVTVGGSPPLTLRATSYMGTLIAKFKIPPLAAIVATSTTAASIKRFTSVIPALQARSDVVANLVRLRSRPVVITASSGVTASVASGRRFTVTLSAHSDVLTALIATRAVKPALTASSGLTVALARLRRIPVLVAATSNVVATQIVAFRYIPTTDITSTSNLAVAVSRVRPFVASIAATSLVSAIFGRARRFVPTLVAKSDTTAFVVRQGAIAPRAVATSAITVTLSRLRSPASLIQATSPVSINLGRLRNVVIVMAATSTVTGNLVRQRSFTALISANSLVAAGLKRNRGFYPDLLATSTLNVPLTFTRAINPLILGTSSLSMSLTIVETVPLTDALNHSLLAVGDYENGTLLGVEGV